MSIFTFTCTFEEFKRIAKDFHDAAPTLNEDELESAWKAVGLAYLGMHEEMWDTSAAILFEMESRTYWNRSIELFHYPPKTLSVE
jgi:hypothetical protein